MSGREWKPGDVGVAETDERFIVTRDGRCAWSTLKGSDVVSGWPSSSDRPLVVIDPSTILPGWNGSLLSSLLEACAEIVAASTAPREIHETTLLRNLADAFDAVLDPKPPKPDEPQGLGAVVEDADGDLWVRASLSGLFRKASGKDGTGRFCRYADIAVVRVLSEGVQAGESA